MYYIAERAVQIKFYAKAILFGDCLVFFFCLVYFFKEKIMIVVVVSSAKTRLPLLLVPQISNQKESLLSSRLAYTR